MHALLRYMFDNLKNRNDTESHGEEKLTLTSLSLENLPNIKFINNKCHTFTFMFWFSCYRRNDFYFKWLIYKGTASISGDCFPISEKNYFC